MGHQTRKCKENLYPQLHGPRHKDKQWIMNCDEMKNNTLNSALCIRRATRVLFRLTILWCYACSGYLVSIFCKSELHSLHTYQSTNRAVLSRPAPRDEGWRGHHSQENPQRNSNTYSRHRANAVERMSHSCPNVIINRISIWHAGQCPVSHYWVHLMPRFEIMIT